MLSRMARGQNEGEMTYAGCKNPLVNPNKATRTFTQCKGLVAYYAP